MFIIVIKATTRQFNITAALIHWGSSADQAALSSINFQFEARPIEQSKVTNQIEFNKFFENQIERSLRIPGTN